ncbi:MAG: outer membrane beta-barrel protein [Candidatus Kapaibacteriota bacterium]
MKKLFYLSITFLAIFFNTSFAGALEFGINAGIATPDDKMNQVYNTNTLQLSQDSIANLISNGMKTGYHLGVKVSMPLNSNFSFIGSVGYNSFPQSEIEVRDPASNQLLATLSTSTKVVPVSAGLNFYLFKTVLSPYIAGDLSYNYISTSVESKFMGTTVPISTTPSDSRFGFGFGIGTDISLGLVDLNIEGKYNYTNLIGKTTNEPNKYYFTLILGLTF